MRNCVKSRIALSDLTLVALAMTVVVLFGVLPQQTNLEKISATRHKIDNGATGLIRTNEPMPSHDELFRRWQNETHLLYVNSSRSDASVKPVSFESSLEDASVGNKGAADQLSSVPTSPSPHRMAPPFSHYIIAVSSGLFTAFVFLVWAWMSPKIKLDRIPQVTEPSRLSENGSRSPNTDLMILAFPANWIKVRQPWSVRFRAIAQAGLVVAALVVVWARG
ncbi:hypothetical protein Q31b_15400 [Novipirellula aureliae]|uniref:Uncharacterized protein n=1 Tax=Novipirellula aureliae TaxID=2527966 RepID=A0A5C6E5L9_9BACT|nr:hypothetical protein [Novipirellula aureliae]TWU44005.1 hypothetical protein Q31b_15400 [Novipirellula aureliae]